MNYVLLLYADHTAWSSMSEEETRKAREESMPRWLDLFEYLQTHAKSIDGAELDDPTTARTLRYRGGDPVVTDGPFAETKELIGGVFFLACENLDEAIDMAAQVPVAERGSIEIRPVAERTAGSAARSAN